MGWGALAAGIIGAGASMYSSNKAAKGANYRPWDVGLLGLGNASFQGGKLNLQGDSRYLQMNNNLWDAQNLSLGQFAGAQQSALGQDYLRNITGQANLSSENLFSMLAQGAGMQNQYQPQNFMGGVNNGLLQNIDPTAISNNYTDLLRQQAIPQEQQQVQSALSGLFGSGRLGTTGGANVLGQLSQAQQQADIGRQVAGQQFGLTQALQAQQGYDAARANQMGLMMNQFGANQQGMMNQFGMDQGMFGRLLDTYNSGSDMTQDRFSRAMQLFGAENAMGQQYLQNFQSLLGAQQGQQQQLMDLARIGSSVGQAQTAAGANAAGIRNQGNQDAIAGFMSAFNQWNSNRNKNSGGEDG